MARYTGSVCKLCRREGVKLFLKGTKCATAKCTWERRKSPPGMHTWRKEKMSEYGKRFREKQRVKRYYGLFEKQFKKYFQEAEILSSSKKSKKAAVPRTIGETLLVLLEIRLDNVVYQGGFAYSRPQARQMVHHGHIWVNGKKVDIPSYSVKPGDIIEPAHDESSHKLVETIRQSLKKEVPSWLKVEDKELKLQVVNEPKREDIKALDIREQLIVEFFSR